MRFQVGFAHQGCDAELLDQLDEVHLPIQLLFTFFKHFAVLVFHLAAKANSYQQLLPPCEVEIFVGLSCVN